MSTSGLTERQLQVFGRLPRLRKFVLRNCKGLSQWNFGTPVSEFSAFAVFECVGCTLTVGNLLGRMPRVHTLKAVDSWLDWSHLGCRGSVRTFVMVSDRMAVHAIPDLDAFHC